MRYLITILAVVVSGSLLAQNTPIIVQAESGTLDAGFASQSDGGVGFIAIQSVLVDGAFPGTGRTATYSVTFPQAGTYDLYIRIRVGSNNADDDSFFYGNGFGTKAAGDGNDWITSNGHSGSGFTDASTYITGNGDAGSNVWKWMNVSEFNGNEPPVAFTVVDGNLTQTFMLGAREDGLSIDKFAFAPSHLFYKVSNLDNGEAGVTEIPIPVPMAKNRIKFVGSAYSSAQATNFNYYWNQITPENAGKWGSVEGTRDNMNWTALDAAHTFGASNGFLVKHHVLVWGSQQPSWIETLPAAEQLQEIHAWYAAVAQRYPNLEVIEVVNEPLHAPPNKAGSGNYAAALGGNGASGWEWILQSFRLARQYFPNARLMLNDYGIISDGGNIAAYKNIINLLLKENLIDQVGIQCHAFNINDLSAATIKTNLDALAQTGLPIYVTELDIDGLDDNTQLTRYQTIFPALYNHPSVAGITLWGFRPGHWREAQGAILITSGGVERSALQWLKNYVSTGTDVNVSGVTLTAAGGSATIVTEGGTLKINTVVAPANASLQTTEWSVDDPSVATISAAGVLTAVGNGTVTVTSKAMDGSGITQTITVTVSNQGVITDFDNNIEQHIAVATPNPAIGGRFTLNGISALQSIVIHDALGRVVNRLEPGRAEFLNVELNVSPGVYFLRCYDGKKMFFRSVLIR